MKQIQAYIKKHKLNDVVRALKKVPDITGMSVIDRDGYGLGWTQESIESEKEMMSGFKLELFCKGDVVEDVVDVIERAAHTGLKGDGKIYVSSIDQAVRISTGGRGEDAV